MILSVAAGNARMKDLQDRSDFFVAYLIDRFLEDCFKDRTDACQVM